MNKRKIISFMGKIILIEVFLMIPSLIVALSYGDGDAMAFIETMVPALILGVLLCRVRQSEQRISSRDGYFIVAAAWIVISLIGALPLYLSGGFESYFVLMVMPMNNDNSMHLVRAEVPGPTAGKLVPRMRTTSMILYGIYAAMTLILILLLLAFGMQPFDTFCIAFGTAGTGGFAVSSAGIAGYNSLAIEIILGIFMLLFGINFNVYHLLLLRKFREAFSMEEIKVYLGIAAFAVVSITVNIAGMVGNVGTALRQAFFQVSSILTTTGFSTVDYEAWPEYAKHLIVFLSLVGACAGSTGGGFKVSRAIILVKSFFQEIHQIINPKEVITVRLDGKAVGGRTLESTRIYAATYMVLICIFTLILSLDGLDFTTNVTAVITCFNNIGPGLNLVGPMSNFSVYSDWAKVLLSFVMLTGRLEIFPMFLLFARSAHDR